MTPNKISLIGMPSAGKTTIAKELASKLGYKFVDLDSMVEEKEGKSLIDILEEKGGKYFLDIEYSFLSSLLEDDRVVISTAGSIIYHDLATSWLKSNTAICFIDTDLSVIEERLSIKPKAVVGLREKGLAKLWEERIPVYKSLANITVKTDGKRLSEVVNEIAQKIVK